MSRYETLLPDFAEIFFGEEINIFCTSSQFYRGMRKEVKSGGRRPIVVRCAVPFLGGEGHYLGKKSSAAPL